MTNPALCGVPFAGPLTAKVSAYVDDIVVPRCLDIKVVKKAVARYEEIAGVNISLDKSEGLRVDVWRG